MVGIVHITCEAVYRSSMIKQNAKQLISIMVGTVRVTCEVVYKMSSITRTGKFEVVVKLHIASIAIEPNIAPAD